MIGSESHNEFRRDLVVSREYRAHETSAAAACKVDRLVHARVRNYGGDRAECLHRMNVTRCSRLPAVQQGRCDKCTAVGVCSGELGFTLARHPLGFLLESFEPFADLLALPERDD